jgi:hypothetical protein
VSPVTGDAASRHGSRPSNPISRLEDFAGFAIRQQELVKAAAIGVKWQEIFPGCREMAE